MNSFLVVTDSASIAEESRELLEELLGHVVVEVVHEDGRLALSRLERRAYDLVLLPLELRKMEALTLLRAAGPEVASRIALLTPDTLEGFRTAWEGMRLGARDLIPTKGQPPQRLKGHHDLRLRQIAWHLSHAGTLAPLSLPSVDEFDLDGPVVLVPETRHLVAVAEWIVGLPRTVPVVLRAPEGARLRRVLGEELTRWIPWPTRSLKHGDRLAPGHVHLFAEPEAIELNGDSERCIARVVPNVGAPGGWSARRDLLSHVAGSTVPFTLWTGDPLEPEEEDLVEAGGFARVVCDPDSTGRWQENAA
ncbi:MAG: hypothetical protein R3E97_09695 [Candidatus Eisenbacteria bacterium]